MNILIIGGNSLLGRNLVAQLSVKHRVYVSVRDKKFLKFKEDGISVIEIDLTDFDENSLPKEIDVIFYLAQSERFREFPEGSLDVLEVNVVAPNKIIKWAAQRGVKSFIYASSGGVYTNPNKPVKEFFDINAQNKLGYYLNSKLSAEMLLKNYATFFDTFVLIRPFFMYGPRQNNNMLMPRLMYNIMNENEIHLPNKDGIKINPIYIDDAALAVAKLLDVNGEHIFNIAGNEIVSIRELCELMAEILGKTPHYTFDQENQADLVADISKMKEILYTPTTSLHKGLELLYKALER